MNIEDIAENVGKNIWGTIVSLALFSGGIAYLWDKNDKLEEKDAAINARHIALKDAELAFEKNRSIAELQLKDRLVEANQSEKEVQDLQGRLKEALDTAKGDQGIVAKNKQLNELIEKYNDARQELERLYSAEAKRAKAEDAILAAMKEFGELGVDMQHPNWCDKEYTTRYNNGRALISQIYALNAEYKISPSYTNFVRAHTRSEITVHDGSCYQGATAVRYN